MAPVKGRDYSSVQGDIDWAAEAKAGVRFAYIKCGNGNDGVDPNFDRNVAQAQAADIHVGAYDFLYDIATEDNITRDPVRQAQAHFKAMSGVGMHKGELPPVCDLEWPPIEDWEKWGCSPVMMRANGLLYLATLKSLMNRTPVIYTYPYFWGCIEGGKEPLFANYPLWLANYGTLMPLPPWAGYTILQVGGGTGFCTLKNGNKVPVDEDIIPDEATFQALLSP